MKIKADYANAPQWKNLTIKSRLPEQLKCLDELAHNMWWAWTYEARNLFKSLDEELYEKVGHNPVLLLDRLGYDRKEAIVNDKAIMKNVKEVYAKFRAYMDVEPDKNRPSVAYFSMEYGLNQVLKIYSGGLGMLAGDYLKEASDSNVNLCGVGFLYRFGYFTQSLSMDGQQIAKYDAQNFNSLPIERVLDENGNPYDLYSLLSVAKLSDGDIPNDAIAVNTRLSDNDAQIVKEAFLKMASDEKGLEIMGAWNHSGYIEANEADYDTIAQYIELATE